MEIQGNSVIDFRPSGTLCVFNNERGPISHRVRDMGNRGRRI